MAKYDVTASMPEIIKAIDGDVVMSSSQPYDSPEPPEGTVAWVEVIVHALIAGAIYLVIYLYTEYALMALFMGVVYFFAMTTLRVLARTHVLTSWMRFLLEYRLASKKLMMFERMFMAHMELTEASKVRMYNEEPVQPPSALPMKNWVEKQARTEFSPEAIAEGTRYALSLYDPRTGLLSGEKVWPKGKIKVAVIGSRRTKSKDDQWSSVYADEAHQYLVKRGFIGDGPGGSWVNYKKFPSTTEAEKLRRYNYLADAVN